MNREIKFRVWEVPTKTMTYLNELLCWEHGYMEANYFCNIRGRRLTGLHQDIFTTDDKVWEKASKERFILQQFTGLKDKNGREIYEGDIYKEYYKVEGIKVDTKWVYNSMHANATPLAEEADFILVSEVYWDNDWHCYHARRKSSLTGKIESSHWFPFTGDNIEVIGNIFENPELLK